ncbi:MAG: hypothetical protein R3C05_30340, partial [Pirellulaceae bacterium]
ETLVSLECKFAQVTDEGVIALKSAKGIQVLGLSGRPITGRSLEALCEFPNLNRLNIDACDRVTTDDLEYIFKMRKLRHLSRQLPAEFRERLQSRRSRLKLFP